MSSVAQGLVGQVVDERYEIRELLSEGGMGQVYVAEHLKLHKPVAFKVVRADLAGNAELAMRFAREAMVTSVIDHPNVVSAIDYGTLPESGAYLVMQLVRGETLSAALEHHGSMHWLRAAEIAAQVADALVAAHKHGIVHRDLKPDNVVLQPREGGGDLVKILDFGVARYQSDSLQPPRASLRPGSAEKLTLTGTLIGTPGYMAPEQAAGETADEPADLYALGVTLWEMVVGRSPFQAQDLQALLREQLTTPIGSLRDATGDLTLPEELDVLCTRLCAIDPADRPQDAGAVRDVLRRVATRAVANAPPSQREVDLVGSAERGDATGSNLVSKPQATRGHTHRTTRLVALGVGATVVAIATLVWLGQLEVTPASPLGEAVRTIAPGATRTPPEQPTAALRPAAPSAAVEATVTAPTSAKQAHPVTSAPTETSRADELAAAVEPPASALDAGPDPTAEPTDPMQDYLTVLTIGRTHASRLAAASSVLALVGDAGPPASQALALARLQVAQGCAAIEAELDAIEALADPRVLPALDTLADHPAALCGPGQGPECEVCLAQRLAQLPRLRVSWGAQAGP